MARERLKSAVRMHLTMPDAPAAAGEPVSLEVAIANVAAGHAIPTSITELRQVWIDLQVLDAEGAEVFRSGAVAEDGAVDPDAVMFHSVLVDEEGEVTYLPWRAARMVKEKLIPPGETVRERFAFTPADGTPGPFQVRARLRYRSAPQEVLDELFGKGRFDLEIVDMAEAEGTLPAGAR